MSFNTKRGNAPVTTLGALTLLMMLYGTVQAAGTEVYRCAGPDGVRFADEPCGPGAETINIRDNRIGGSLGDNLPEYPEPEADPEPEAPRASADDDDPCRHINSTRLRTLLARNQVIPGMTREQVERAFGRTSEVYTEPRESWVYQTRHYGAIYELTYVYFRDGCVTDVEYRKP